MTGPIKDPEALLNYYREREERARRDKDVATEEAYRKEIERVEQTKKNKEVISPDYAKSENMERPPTTFDIDSSASHKRISEEERQEHERERNRQVKIKP